METEDTLLEEVKQGILESLKKVHNEMGALVPINFIYGGKIKDYTTIKSVLIKLIEEGKIVLFESLYHTNEDCVGLKGEYYPIDNESLDSFISVYNKEGVEKAKELKCLTLI